MLSGTRSRSLNFGGFHMGSSFQNLKIFPGRVNAGAGSGGDMWLVRAILVWIGIMSIYLELGKFLLCD